MVSILRKSIAEHPIIKDIIAEQTAARTREEALAKMVEHVAAQLQTIIDQNDRIVTALHNSGLLNGHAER